MYAFTLGIFSEAGGVVGMQKSLHLPIKGGVRARVNGFRLFLELMLFAEGITVSLRSYIVRERVKNSHLC
jgi:hypothetical protein